MSEALVYLLPQGMQQADASWPVLVWTARGQVQRCCLSALRESLGADAKVLVVLPIEMLGSCLTAPMPGRKPTREALAYAVEDQLAAALDSLHLAYGAADREGRRRALVIERERWQALLALLQAEGIRPVAIQADADRLFAEPGALWLEGRWLIGGAGLPLLAASASAAQTLAQALPAMAWQSEAPGAPCNQHIDSAIEGLIHGRPGVIDLQQASKRHWQLPWQQAMAGLMLVWSLMCVADLVRASWLQQRSEQLRADNLQQFQRWAPGQPLAGDLSRLVEALQQRPLPSTAAQRLAGLAEQVVESGNLSLQRAALIPGQGWRVEVQGLGFADLQRLRERVPALVVEHARQSDQGVQATLMWAGGE
ncbi:MAG TPA: type II secretion system protein GspL [Pseudomonas sp.]|nr:type II secretion system protein GspL [Pseudomonas sp.]